MKNKFLVTVMALFIAQSVFAQKADDILGYWLSEDKAAQIEIFKDREGKYDGKIVWLKNPNKDDGSPKVDTENPDPKKRNQRIMGLQLLNNFVFDDNEWEDGTIYDPKGGSTYDCYMWFDEKTQKVLNIKGFIGVSWLGRSSAWTRESTLRQ